MRVQHSLELDAPRDAVWKAFDDRGNLRKWQPTLVECEHVAGAPGRPGAQSRLTFLEDGRRIVLLETIVRREEPSRLDGTYDSPLARNTVHNTFVELPDGRTRWEVDATFEFRGLVMRVVGLFVRDAIRKRMLADNLRFKALLEQGALS